MMGETSSGLPLVRGRTSSPSVRKTAPGRFANRFRVQGQRGFTFVAVLLALLIAAALYFGYFHLQSVTGERLKGIAAIDAARAITCRTNRQTIEREVVLWSVNHPDEAPTLAALQAEGLQVPSCPEGGRYDIVGHEVHCSVHR
jgi:competence protein ComGC